MGPRLLDRARFDVWIAIREASGYALAPKILLAKGNPESQRVIRDGRK